MDEAVERVVMAVLVVGVPDGKGQADQRADLRDALRSLVREVRR